MSDAILILSFGGPERPEDVLPFLENVTRGRNIPRERLLEVAGHYDHFGGKSPINDYCRGLVSALRDLLAREGPDLRVCWGNRNWHPLLADTVRTMAADGIRRAFTFATSAFGSYSGCRQYREDIERARAAVGASAPAMPKLRLYYNHPGFVEPMAERVRQAFERLPASRREEAALVFTAHSIPLSMAAASPYAAQLREACRLVSERAGRPAWRLVYQSRSGPPSQPWLEPDILDHLRAVAAERSARDVVIAPVGFVSDHIEVLYDLDTEARGLCEELGLGMERAGTVGLDPRFVAMIRELVIERLSPGAERRALGSDGAWGDDCPAGCCAVPQRPAAAR